MNYILYVSQRNKIVGLTKSSTILIRPASLGQWETREIREAMLAKGTVFYENAVANGDNYTNPGFFIEPREVNSLNVMWLIFDHTKWKEKTLWKK